MFVQLLPLRQKLTFLEDAQENMDSSQQKKIPVDELKAFEKDLVDLLTNKEFKENRNDLINSNLNTKQ